MKPKRKDTMKTIFALLVVFTISVHAGDKPKPALVDSTIQKVAIKDLIVTLESQAKQVTEQANAQLTEISGQIKLLRYLQEGKQDSVTVPKVKP